MNLRYITFLSLTWLLAVPLLVGAQGVTTASIGGRIVDDAGEGLIGATVVAVHEPSGSTYGNATDLEGYYRLPGVRVGGPYTITVSYTGYESDVARGITLGLGERFQYNLSLSETSTELGVVEVTADRNGVFSGDRTGQETVVDESTIDALPTISRSLADFVKFNPLANIQEGTDGFSFSLGGQNNRFNTLYIDGAVNNDVFGLAGSGSNGGQTGVQPISIDAIEQLVVSVAPFDVRQSGFAGGAVNAVTRSGTNKFDGSAYYLTRSEDLTRSEAFTNEDGVRFPEVSPFSATTFGARFGGAIKRDKVFYFVSAEVQRDDIPQPFSLDNYEGQARQADIDRLGNYLRENFNFDPGSFDNNTAYLNSEKFLGKLDFNLSPNHKLSVRHSYVNAENLEARNSSNNFLGFLNGSEFFVSKTNSSAVELNSIFGQSMSNNLTVTGTFVRDDRDQFNQQFPEVALEDGDGNILFGGERFSSANLLNQDAVTVTNDFQFFRGKHNILAGVNFEYFNAGNLFIRENFGYYQFDNVIRDSVFVTGLERFLAGEASDSYNRSFSLVDGLSGDESQAIADFRQINLGLYVQDDIQLTNDFSLTAGLRFDFPIWPTEVPINRNFNDSTVALIEGAGYDLQGARTGQFIGTTIMVSPRVGFTYDVNGDDRTQLRGGVGVFTSRIPLVWPGGAYNNYGLNVGGVFNRRNVPFVGDINGQPFSPDLSNPNNITPSGQIDLFAEDFKLPQVLKINLAADQLLGNGFIATVEGVFTKTIQAPFYQNVNLRPSTRNLDGGPDQRPLFDNNTAQRIDPSYTGIFLASNTSKGYAYNLVGSLSKTFTGGLQANVGYSYGDAYSVLDGTSSQNSSQFGGYINPNGRNQLIDNPERSTFAPGHRVFAQASYNLEYLNGFKTRVSVFYNGVSSNPYTYTINANNNRFVNDGGFSRNEPIFIPASRSDINLVDLTFDGPDGVEVTVTADQQYAALNTFIENDPYLSDNRGGYAERGGNFGPFSHQLDARILQDFGVTVAGNRHAFQVSFDVFNVLNLLSEDWGKVYATGSTFQPISLANRVDQSSNSTPQYTVARAIIDNPEFRPFEDNLVVAGRVRSSRWTGQVGLRYLFN